MNEENIDNLIINHVEKMFKKKQFDIHADFCESRNDDENYQLCDFSLSFDFENFNKIVFYLEQDSLKKSIDSFIRIYMDDQIYTFKNDHLIYNKSFSLFLKEVSNYLTKQGYTLNCDKTFKISSSFNFDLKIHQDTLTNSEPNKLLLLMDDPVFFKKFHEIKKAKYLVENL